MDTLLLTTLLICGGVLLGAIILFKALRKPSAKRPSINIDFDTAKEREDKNRYFS